jgi:hypothetical protein
MRELSGKAARIREKLTAKKLQQDDNTTTTEELTPDNNDTDQTQEG